MPSRAFAAAVLSAALHFGTAGTGRADLTYAHANAVQTVTAGFFCVTPPDANAFDVGGRGHVNLFSAPFPFVTEGDRLTSEPGIGIGVVARLAPLLRNSVLTARESHGDPCCDKEQSWLTRPRPDGTIWLGHLEGSAADFPPGLWRFSLWRGPDEVFSYEITVLPADPRVPHSCGAATS